MANIPYSLSEVGVSRDHFPEIVKATLGDGSVAFNPTELGEKEIHAILEMAYEGSLPTRRADT